MSKQFIATLIGLFVLVALGFFFVLHWGSQLPLADNGAANPNTPGAPVAPPVTSVTLSITTSTAGNTLYVTWEYLPGGTTALQIFRSTKGKNNWALWKTITLAPSDLAGGSAGISIGTDDFSKYSFYLEAVGNGGSGNENGSSTAQQTTLWTSSTTEPTYNPPNSGPSAPPSPPPASPSSTDFSLPSSTTNNGNNTSTNTHPPAPSGTPYYNPELQLSAYGQDQSGNFWVQHVDQKIQIGWQNLPSITDSVIIYRSPNQDGPWTEVLRQENPGTNGAYSIQVVDNTLGQAYYYEMNAEAGEATIATYGPVYLAPVGQ